MSAAGSAANANALTRSEEDYLSDIYRLGGQGPVRTGDIAQRLGVTPASASGMLKRLSRDGLVNYREYAGSSLTADGERAALSVVRRHRVVERFLTDLLQFGWEQVDALAHQMEHALPDVVVDAIERLLGDPATCPHGFPIPDKDGQVAAEPQLSIQALKTGESAQVREVEEGDPALLEFLRDCGLVPGAMLRVTQVNPIDGTVVVAVADGVPTALGPMTAAAVRVAREARGAGGAVVGSVTHRASRPVAPPPSRVPSQDSSQGPLQGPPDAPTQAPSRAPSRASAPSQPPSRPRALRRSHGTTSAGANASAGADASAASRASATSTANPNEGRRDG